MSVYSKFLELVSGSPKTIDLSTNTLGVQGLQINAATGGGNITLAAHSATTSYSIVFPAAQAGGSNYVLANDGSGNLSWISSSTGSVTSVALFDGSSTPIYSISGSPVTSSGTLTFTLNTQTANTVLAGPTTGSAAQPTFRSLVSADIPNNAANTTGTASNITATSNSTLTTLSALTSASSLSTVGTITSGTWSATPIGISYGGTGQTTAISGFNALSPMTTAGDIIYENATPSAARLPIGSTGQVLTVVSGLPAWSTPTTTPPGGSTGNLQYNNGSSGFAGSSASTDGNNISVNTTYGYRLNGISDSNWVIGRNISNFSAPFLSSQLSTNFIAFVCGNATNEGMVFGNNGGTQYLNLDQSANAWFGNNVNAVGTLSGSNLTSGGHAILDLLASNNLSDVASASIAFKNISPLTTKGDIIYENATPAPARLPIGSTGQILTVVSGLPTWANPATSGTVTSVAFADNSSTPIYSVSGSPVTSSGTLAITLNSQSANMVFAGPASGSASQPSFRSLVVNDIPSLSTLYLPLTGGTMNGVINMNSYKITNLANGTSTNDAVTYGQLENALSGISYRPAVNLYDNVDTTLPTSTSTLIDGVTVTTGTSVLFVNLSSNNNEVYVATVSGSSVSWTARLDNDRSSAAPVTGDTIEVLSGTTYSDSVWVYNGTAFIQFNGGNQIQPGNALSKTGNTLNVVYDNSTIGLNGSNQLYVLNSGITSTQLASQSVTASKLGAVAGNGLTGGSGSVLAVQSASGSAISVSSSGVSVSVSATGGIQVTSSSLALLLADTSLSTSSSGVKINLATSSGLAVSSGLLVNTDGSSIDINGSNQIEVKASGITTSKLATITDGVTLDQLGSGSTLEIKSGGVGTTQLANNAVTASKIATSSFDQTTITGGNGNAASVVYAPSVQRQVIAGTNFSANTTYALRWGQPSNGETAGSVYPADYNASSSTLFYVIGLFNSSTAISSGNTITMVTKGPLTLGSSDSTFISANQGFPVWLGSSGGILPNSSVPTVSGEAAVKLGIAETSSIIWVDIQVMGIN